VDVGIKHFLINLHILKHLIVCFESLYLSFRVRIKICLLLLIFIGFSVDLLYFFHFKLNMNLKPFLKFRPILKLMIFAEVGLFFYIYYTFITQYVPQIQLNVRNTLLLILLASKGSMVLQTLLNSNCNPLLGLLL
jgi:hypothetical protein